MSVASKIENEEGSLLSSLKGAVVTFPKTIIVIVAIAALLLVAAVTNSVSSSNYRVKLNVDGVVRPVEGWMTTVGDVLENANISVKQHDIVTPTVDSPIHNGQTITVQTSHKVYVREGDKRKEMWVTPRSIYDSVQAIKVADRNLRLIVERTGDEQLSLGTQQLKVDVKHGDAEVHTVLPAGSSIETLFERHGIKVGALDEVTAYSQAPGQLTLRIDSISRSTTTEEVEIDYETTTHESPSLYKDEKRVITKGKKGLKVVTYAIQTFNGDETKKVELSTEVKEEPVNEVVEVGTKERPAGSSDSVLAAHATAPANPTDVQNYARSILPDYGMADSEFGCVVELFNRESGWRWNARNSSSGAYGIPQALPGSKMASAGADWATNPQTQVRWGLMYIQGRYGTPCKALALQQSRGWY